MERKTIYFSKWRCIFLLMGSIIYAGIGISLLFSFLLILSLLGLVFIAISAWVGRLSYARLTGKIPALVIDEDGIEDNSRWMSIGRVTWDEIAMIETKRIFFMKFILIHLKDTKKVIGRISNPFKKISIASNTLFGQTPMKIQTQMMAISYNELAQFLQDIDLENPGFKDLSKHLID